MNKITFKFHFTLTKIIGIFILIFGFIISLVLKSETVMVVTIGAVSGLYGVKTAIEGMVSAKRDKPIYGE